MYIGLRLEYISEIWPKIWNFGFRFEFCLALWPMVETFFNNLAQGWTHVRVWPFWYSTVPWLAGWLDGCCSKLCPSVWPMYIGRWGITNEYNYMSYTNGYIRSLSHNFQCRCQSTCCSSLIGRGQRSMEIPPPSPNSPLLPKELDVRTL
jgi:hypothetical protein